MEASIILRSGNLGVISSTKSFLGKAINELIETEENYVQELHDVCTVYLPTFHILNSVTAEDEKVIFSNIHEIFSLHRALLSDLNEADSDLVLIAKAFLSRAADFEVYVEYCAKYYRANERLFELKQLYTCLASTLNDIQSSLGHTLPLSSHLHKPIQRITKYHLILENLMKMAETEPARVMVQEAYIWAKECAMKINNSTRPAGVDRLGRELHELILNIRESEHLGKHIRQGEMTLRNEDLFIDVVVYLFENFLIICQKDGDLFYLHTKLKCSGLLLVEECSKKVLEFSLIPLATPSKPIILMAKDLKQKIDWCIQIEKLTANNIPAKAKKVLMTCQDSMKDVIQSSCQRELGSPKLSSISLLSPKLLGKRLKKQFYPRSFSVITKSKSTFSLLTEEHSNRRLQRSTVSVDSLSNDLDSDSSSDLGLSSASEQGRRGTIIQQKSCDDASIDRISQLNKNIEQQHLDSWHCILRRKIQQYSSNETPEGSYEPIRRVKSCSDLDLSPITSELEEPGQLKSQSLHTKNTYESTSPKGFANISKSIQSALTWMKRTLSVNNLNNNISAYQSGNGKTTPNKPTDRSRKNSPTEIQAIPVINIQNNDNITKSFIQQNSLIIEEETQSKPTSDSVNDLCDFSVSLADDFTTSLLNYYDNVLSPKPAYECISQF